MTDLEYFGQIWLILSTTDLVVKGKKLNLEKIDTKVEEK